MGMLNQADIDFDEAVKAVADYLADADSHQKNYVSYHNQAKRILWGCLSDQDRTRRVMR